MRVSRSLLLHTCFFLSGFAALLYETAWTRELSLLFGASAIAIAAVLAAYMGGLAAGAAVAARLAPYATRPALIYGILELAIALSALGMPLALRGVNAVYVAWFGGGLVPPPEGALAATTFQMVAAFLLLLVPTTCMGATLPLLARQSVESDAEVGPRIGRLYAVNTAGAIAGVLVAGFVLLPELGLRRTVWVGAAVNLAVFLAACAFARVPAPQLAAAESPAGRQLHWVLPVIALSGAVSFAYEVMWMRLFVHQVGGSVYAFATMLGSFLTGISLGGAIAAPLARNRASAATGLAIAFIASAAIGLAAFAAADHLPALAEWLGAKNQADVGRNALMAACVLTPLATAIGATFPFAVRLAARGASDAASAAARVFAWNTVGAIVGSLGTGLALLPLLGFARMAQLAVLTSLGLAAITGVASDRRRLALLALVCGVPIAIFPPSTPWELVRRSPFVGQLPGEVLYFGVGRSSTVLLLSGPEGLKLTTNGLPESSVRRPGLPPKATEPVRWMGLLPVLLRPDARQALYIGLGFGRSLEQLPSALRQVDVIELEPEVVAANRVAGSERQIDPLSDPRIRLHMNDARGALRLSEGRYDVIVSQPSHPWTAGSASLYTQEFFELVRSRLGPGGVFVQWIGLAFVDEELLRTLLATFTEVFSNVVVFQVQASVLMAGSDQPFDLPSSVSRAIREAPSDFEPWGISEPEDVVASLLLDDRGTRAFAAGASVNTDDRNLLAARSARLRDGTGVALPALARSFDALPSIAGELHSQRVVRHLVARRAYARAARLAHTLPEGDQQIAFGWIARALGRTQEAVERVQRGAAAGGQAHEARAALLLLSAEGRLENGGAEMAEATAAERAIARARRFEASGEWREVARIEADMARIPPGDPLFEEAVRLRASWRVATDEPEPASEAIQIIDAMLVRDAVPTLLLLRTRASMVRGEPEAAWASLHQLVRKVRGSHDARRVASEALRLARQLPSDGRASSGMEARVLRALNRLARGQPLPATP